MAQKIKSQRQWETGLQKQPQTFTKNKNSCRKGNMWDDDNNQMNIVITSFTFCILWLLWFNNNYSFI